MTGIEIEQSCIKKTPESLVTRGVQELWGEIDYLYQDCILNKDLQKIADEVDELRTFIEGCMESNDTLYANNPHMTERRAST